MLNLTFPVYRIYISKSYPPPIFSPIAPSFFPSLPPTFTKYLGTQVIYCQIIKKKYFYLREKNWTSRKNVQLVFLSYHTRIDHNYFVKSIALYFIKELIRVQVARPLILSLIRPNQSEQNLTPEFNLTNLSSVLTSRSKTLLQSLILLISHTS